MPGLVQQIFPLIGWCLQYPFANQNQHNNTDCNQQEGYHLGDPDSRHKVQTVGTQPFNQKAADTIANKIGGEQSAVFPVLAAQQQNNNQ